jgi:hypothetical protein
MKKRKVERNVTRRDFIKGTAMGTLGLALYGRDRDLLGGTRQGVVPDPAPSDAPLAAQDLRSVVVLVRSEKAVGAEDRIDAAAVQEMIDTAVKEFAGETDTAKAWAKFVRPEDTVGVKFTHCGWMRVHTEQPVIDAIVKRVGEAGVAGDRIFARDEGLPVAKCTALINVPTVKVHTLAGIAVSLKNYINFSSKPSSYHAPSTNLGEIYLMPEVKGKTRLIIVDMLRPYFGPGPQINPLHRWNYRGIMVGTDPVAIDSTCLRLCQVKRRLFKGEDWPISPPPDNIHAADVTFHLGTSDPAKIKLVKLGWDQDVLI